MSDEQTHGRASFARVTAAAAVCLAVASTGTACVLNPAGSGRMRRKHVVAADGATISFDDVILDLPPSALARDADVVITSEPRPAPPEFEAITPVYAVRSTAPLRSPADVRFRSSALDAFVPWDTGAGFRAQTAFDAGGGYVESVIDGFGRGFAAYPGGDAWGGEAAGGDTEVGFVDDGATADGLSDDASVDDTSNDDSSSGEGEGEGSSDDGSSDDGSSDDGSSDSGSSDGGSGGASG